MNAGFSRSRSSVCVCVCVCWNAGRSSPTQRSLVMCPHCHIGLSQARWERERDWSQDTLSKKGSTTCHFHLLGGLNKSLRHLGCSGNHGKSCSGTAAVQLTTDITTETVVRNVEYWKTASHLGLKSWCCYIDKIKIKICHFDRHV